MFGHLEISTSVSVLLYVDCYSGIIEEKVNLTGKTGDRRRGQDKEVVSHLCRLCKMM